MSLSPEDKQALDSALVRGINNGDVEMVELAMDKGANPDAFVRLARCRRQFPVTLYRKALDKGADAEQMLYSGIEYAAPAVVQLAVETGKAGLNISIKPQNGDSAVPLAAWAYSKYNDAIFSYLVSRGMDVDMPDRMGATVLLRAVQDAAVDKIDAFLKMGANPLAKDNRGQFPLKEVQTAHPGGGTTFDNNRSRLIRDMMKQLPDDGATPAPKPANTKAEAFNDFATRAEIDVRKPITVRKKPEDGAKPDSGDGFKL